MNDNSPKQKSWTIALQVIAPLIGSTIYIFYQKFVKNQLMKDVILESATVIIVLTSVAVSIFIWCFKCRLLLRKTAKHIFTHFKNFFVGTNEILMQVEEANEAIVKKVSDGHYKILEKVKQVDKETLNKIKNNHIEILKQVQNDHKAIKKEIEKSNKALMDELRKANLYLNKLIETNINAQLASRFFYLEKISMNKEKISIFFSHRENIPHPESQYDEMRFYAPPSPWTEENLIMRTWGWGFNNLGIGNVNRYCSCIKDKEPNVFDELKKQCVILFGSSKTNPITELFLEEAHKEPECRINFKFREIKTTNERNEDITEYAILDISNDQLYKPSIQPENQDSTLTDFALITRTKNPYNLNNYLFIFAGCKAAATLALEYFFTNNEILERISREYSNQEDLQIILKVQYKWGKVYPNFIPSREDKNKIEIEIIYPYNFPGGSIVHIKKDSIKNQLRQIDVSGIVEKD